MSVHPKPRFLRLQIVLTSLLSVLAFSALLSSGPVAHASTSSSSSTTFHGVLGRASKSGTVMATSLTRAINQKPRGIVAPFHGRPTLATSAQRSSSVNRPTAASSKLAAGSLLHNFDGVSAIDNSTALGGLQFEPPDESIATDGTYVLNFVNLTGSIYTKDGGIAKGPFALTGVGSAGGFFGVDGTSNIVSDPRAYYDAASHTWFAFVWEDDISSTGVAGQAYVDLAVNHGNVLTNPFTIYKIDVTDANASGCPCLPDFTIFGIDAYNVYLLPNEFQNSGAFGFNGSQIYAIAKSDLISGVSTPNVVHFGNLSVGGAIAYHLQPAITHGSAPAEYFLNALDPNNTFDNRLGVWALTNREHISTGVIPTLSATVISSEAYAMPVNAQTPPGFSSGDGLATTGLVTADFNSLQEVQYINGHLYSALDTSITVPGDSGARDGIAWFEVTPKLSGGVISTNSSVTNQGYIAAHGLFLLYPHIEQTTNGTTAIVFSYGGPDTYLSAGYVSHTKGKSFGSIQTAAFGAVPDNGFSSVLSTGRWGDYSAGQLDPSGKGIWLATQYIAGNGDQFANWSNRLFEIAA